MKLIFHYILDLVFIYWIFIHLFPRFLIKCQNITRRLFADEFHPTSALHTLIAKEFYLSLEGGGSNSTSIGTRFISHFVLILSLFSY